MLMLYAGKFPRVLQPPPTDMRHMSGPGEGPGILYRVDDTYYKYDINDGKWYGQDKNGNYTVEVPDPHKKLPDKKLLGGSNILHLLTKLANDLDGKGLEKYADEIDNIIRGLCHV